MKNDINAAIERLRANNNTTMVMLNRRQKTIPDGYISQVLRSLREQGHTRAHDVLVGDVVGFDINTNSI